MPPTLSVPYIDATRTIRARTDLRRIEMLKHLRAEIPIPVASDIRINQDDRSGLVSPRPSPHDVVHVRVPE
jgi:hypothetical protein